MKRPLDIGDIGSAVTGLGPSLKPETERMSARKTFVFCELRFSGENCSRSACRGDVTRFVGMTACQWSEFRWDFRGEKKTNLLPSSIIPLLPESLPLPLEWARLVRPCLNASASAAMGGGGA